ncbi:hypothetical protein HYT45_02880 [Candidatus Uhrbacteria bacterium]|nr:hypothetical protein [Candidatus Uhrbacteria bacterium]
MEQEKKNHPNAMAFYNPQGFVPAFKHARAFAGKDGRVATLPDIIAARLTTAPGDYPWEAYFTTMSAEYVGLSADGNPIAIVTHGIGPMVTLDGVLKAYSHEFNDKERNRRGGRISTDEFRKLESGAYGEVVVVDLSAMWSRRRYQFSGHAITAKEIMEELLWQARLGKQWEAYVEHHSKFANDFHRERHEGPYARPCIIAMDGAANCSYYNREMFDHWMKTTPNTAIAHLLSIGGLMNSHHQYDDECEENRTSLASDVSCHEWWNGTRLLGVRPGDELVVHPGLPDYEELVKKHLENLWGSNPWGSKGTSSGFWHLVRVGKQYFTDYPKQGERLDNSEPEFLVTKIEKIAEGPKRFRTTVGGYHGFFKYGIDEVRRIAPLGANAYTVGDIQIEWKDGNPTHHVASVTFYKVEADTSRRLVRMDDIYRDFDLMMSLVD